MEFYRVVGLLRKPLLMASRTLPCRSLGEAVRIDYDVNGIHESCESTLFLGTSEKVKSTSTQSPKALGPLVKVQEMRPALCSWSTETDVHELLAFWKQGHKSWFAEGDGEGLCRLQPLLPQAGS